MGKTCKKASMPFYLKIWLLSHVNFRNLIKYIPDTNRLVFDIGSMIFFGKRSVLVTLFSSAWVPKMALLYYAPNGKTFGNILMCTEGELKHHFYALSRVTDSNSNPNIPILPSGILDFCQQKLWPLLWSQQTISHMLTIISDLKEKNRPRNSEN